MFCIINVSIVCKIYRYIVKRMYNGHYVDIYIKLIVLYKFSGPESIKKKKVIL